MAKDASEGNPWRLHSRKEHFDCEYYTARTDLVTHAGGAPRPYHSVHKKKLGIAVVPIESDGTTILVGQYRYLLDRFTWEVVRGGGIRTISAIDTAKRELAEETGYRATHWLPLFAASASPGTTDEIAPAFVAWGLEGGERHLDPTELITIRRLPFSQAIAMSLSGKIEDLASIAAILAIATRLRCDQLPAELAHLLRNGA